MALESFENFNKENLFIIGYGLGGGFGGISNYEVIEANDEDEAENEAWLRACKRYDDYAGMYGLRDYDQIAEEEDLDYDSDEETIEEIFNEEREDWLVYIAYPYSKEKEKQLSGYHFDNRYKEITDKL